MLIPSHNALRQQPACPCGIACPHKKNSVGEYNYYVSPLSRARTLHGESDYLTPPVPLPMNAPLFDGDASADFYTITPITMDALSL